MIKFSGKKYDWDDWSEKSFARAEFKGGQKLPLCKENNVEYNKVPTASKIKALESKMR